MLYQFFKEFGRKDIFTDGARWYKDKDACKWLRLKLQVYSTELKNFMKRFIQKIKDRTESLTTIFLVEKISAGRTCYALAESVCRYA
jgi:hypothetical protein